MFTAKKNKPQKMVVELTTSIHEVLNVPAEEGESAEPMVIFIPKGSVGSVVKVTKDAVIVSFTNVIIDGDLNEMEVPVKPDQVQFSAIRGA